MHDWSHDCSHNRKSGQIHVKTGLVPADKRNSVPATVFPHLTDGEKECTPHCFSPPYGWGERVYPPLFSPTLQMGRNSVPSTVFPHLTDGEKECTPHSFPPPYRWGETVYPPLFFPTLQMGRKSGLHSFSPSVRWKSESVPPTLFSHCNKMEKKSVPPTLFFPIIEGEKVQRVRNFTEPYSPGTSGTAKSVCFTE